MRHRYEAAGSVIERTELDAKGKEVPRSTAVILHCYSERTSNGVVPITDREAEKLAERIAELLNKHGERR